jgi:hypothetical protein
MFKPVTQSLKYSVNPLNAELNPICYLPALLGTHHILHISGIRVNSFIKKTKGFGWDTRMLVSSPNKIGTDLSFMNLDKLFINMRKTKGPKTKPCGTPCSTLDQFDDVILSFSLNSTVL